MKKLVLILLIILLVGGVGFLLYRMGFFTSNRNKSFSGTLYPPKDSILYLRYNLKDFPLEKLTKDRRVSFLPSYTKATGSTFIIKSGEEADIVFSIDAKEGYGDRVVSYLIDEFKKGGNLIEKRKLPSLEVYEIIPKKENTMYSFFLPQSFYISNLNDTVILTTSMNTFNNVVYIKKEDSLIFTEKFKRVFNRIPEDSKIFGYFNLNSRNIKDGGFYTEVYENELLLRGFYEKVEVESPVPLSHTILKPIDENSFLIFGIRGIGYLLSELFSSLKKEAPLITGFMQSFDLFDFLSLFRNDVAFSLSESDGQEFVIVSNIEGVEDVEEKIENFKTYLTKNFNFFFRKIPFKNSEITIGSSPSGFDIAISTYSDFLLLGSKKGVENAIISFKTVKEENLDKLIRNLKLDISGEITTLFLLDVTKLKNYNYRDFNFSRIYFVSSEEEKEGRFILKVEFKKE